MRTFHLSIALAAAALALPAGADVGDARRILDETAPLHCELLNLRYEALAVPAGKARLEFAEQVREHAGAIEGRLAEESVRFHREMALLPPAERAEIEAHAMALMQKCAQDASARHGVRLALPVRPAAPAAKVEEHGGGARAKASGTEAPAALQAASP